MTPQLLTAGQTITFQISASNLLTYWGSDSNAALDATGIAASGLSRTNRYFGAFRHTAPPGIGQIRLAVTQGSVYYTLSGDADQGNVAQQSTRTTTAETLADVDTNTDVIFTNAGATTATVQSNVPAGWTVNCIQRGGIVSFVVTGGALLSRQSFTRTAGTNAMVTLKCISNAGAAPQVLLLGDGQV